MAIVDESGKMVNVTEDVVEHRTGKAFQCECGQDFGVGYGTDSVKCPTCGKVVVDEKAGERGPPGVVDEQATLGAWS